ncbi:MAG: undecaprenyl-diphosphate phosphatase [Pirellulales bacterium]|nr:undecaprenyl-diphosphate phosphatase [Pirellulales bacterium]
MAWLELILLGVVQGATEFLPVSSSGHLVIVAKLFAARPTETPFVVVLLHAATLGSILVFFHRRIMLLLTRDWRLLGPLAVGTIPAGVIGYVIKSQFTGILESPVQAGVMLLVTAFLLLSSKWIKPGETACENVNYRQAFLIGLMQAAAIAPGISRSGSTIAVGIAVGLKRVAAAEFSFLLAIPVIGGAATWEVWNIITQGELMAGEGWGPMLAAMLAAFLVGLLSLKWLVHWLRDFRLHYFALWCGAVGLFAIVYFGLLGG